MSSVTNKERASSAALALDAFRQCVGDDDDNELIQDLICNLGHLASDAKLDFVSLTARAVSNWTYERRHPNGLGASPQVTIAIAGRRAKCAWTKGGAS